MSDALTKLSNYLLEHSNGIDTRWTAKVIEEARNDQARNLEAELLTELLSTLAGELSCGPNAYEIRQAIAKLKAAAQPLGGETPVGLQVALKSLLSMCRAVYKNYAESNSEYSLPGANGRTFYENIQFAGQVLNEFYANAATRSHEALGGETERPTTMFKDLPTCEINYRGIEQANKINYNLMLWEQGKWEMIYRLVFPEEAPWGPRQETFGTSGRYRWEPLIDRIKEIMEKAGMTPAEGWGGDADPRNRLTDCFNTEQAFKKAGD